MKASLAMCSVALAFEVPALAQQPAGLVTVTVENFVRA